MGLQLWRSSNATNDVQHKGRKWRTLELLIHVKAEPWPSPASPSHLGQFLWLASSFRHWWLAGRPGPSRRRWGGRFSFWRWSWGAWRGIRPGRWAPLETLPCRMARNPWVWGWEISLLHIEVEERGSCTSIHTLTWHFARQTRVRLGCRPCTYRNNIPLPGEHVWFIHLNAAEVLNGSLPNVRKLLVTQKDKIAWSVYSV